MIFQKLTTATFLCSMAVLTACGGGATNPSTPTTPTNPTTPTTPTVPTLSDAAATQAVSTVSLNTSSNAVSAGTSTKGGVTVDSASALTTGMSYVAGLTAGSNGTAEVVAVATPSADIPTSGTATYTGKASATVISSTSKYEITMDASTAVNFGAGNASINLSNVAAGGTVETLGGNPTGNTPTYTANGTETVSVTDLGITSGQIVSGANTAMVASNFGTANTTTHQAAAGTVNAVGVFGGPAAEEVAGVARSQSGNISITFTGAK